MIKEEHASITNQLRNTVAQLKQEQHELFAELSKAKQHSRELEDEISVIKHQQSSKQQEPESGLEHGQGSDTRVEENALVEQVREEERLRMEEENMMVVETEFDRDFVKELDEQCQQQAEVIQQLEKDKHELKSTLFEYQRRYPTLASLDDEKHRFERELRDVKRIRNENNQLKQENEQLKQQASEWTIYLENENIDKFSSPKQIVFELSQGRAAMHEAQRRVKELELQLELKGTNERNLTKTIDDLRNKATTLEQAKKSLEIEKEALVHDKRMLQMHRDLLDHQLIAMSQIEEAKLASHDNNTKYTMTRRIEELEGLIKNLQEEAEKARQEAIKAKLSPVKERVLEFKENPASREQHVRQEQLTCLREENRLLLRQISPNVVIGKRRRDDSSDDAPDGNDDTTCINVPVSTITNLQSEVDELKKTIAGRNKRIMRLQQVFGQKVDEMDHIIQSLLGYSLTFQTDGAVRLQSIYVEGSELAFVFKSNENDQGTIGIVGSRKGEYMQLLQGTYDTFIIDKNDIPGFLSSVTLELMNR
ncbi:mitotic checkpoint protein-domain-containing protein [Dichotomocladium elegans]|nr:mitotic checkpoint protein-domain-containing protein [Dichotomocladium elegans]